MGNLSGHLCNVPAGKSGRMSVNCKKVVVVIYTYIYTQIHEHIPISMYMYMMRHDMHKGYILYDVSVSYFVILY